MVMVNVGDRVRVSKGVTSSSSNSSSSSSSSTSSKLAGKEGHVVGAAKGKQCTVSIDGKEHKISLKDLVVVADGDNDDDGNGSDDGDDGDDGEGDDDDDDEIDGEDDDVDDLVSRTLRKFAAASASTSQAQACSSLRSSLTRAGRLQGKQMMSRGGVVSMKASAAGRQNNAIEAAQARSTLYNPTALVAPPLNAEKVAKPTTVGKGWFDLEPLKMDEKLKRDIKVIQMRNYLDPKRFYKNPDRMGKVLHVGTVVEGPSEYRSSRLTNKERKQTIVEEVLGDATLKDYAKRKYNEIQFQKQNKKKMFKKRKKLRR